MLEFECVIKQFGSMGEKTGWSYISVPMHLAEELSPGTKKSFRIKGYFDHYFISGIAMIPMGEGDFIIPFNQLMRKGTGKRAGAMLSIKIELDIAYEVVIPSELAEMLIDEPEAQKFYSSLSKSHRDYFI